MLVSDKQRRRVGIPVGERLARQIDPDVVTFGGRRVEDQRLAPAAPGVHREEPLITGHRRPPNRLEALARTVPELCDRAAFEIEHADRRIAAIAVLGVRDRDQGLVA